MRITLSQYKKLEKGEGKKKELTISMPRTEKGKKKNILRMLKLKKRKKYRMVLNNDYNK